jgi:hypothetical protein
MRASFLYVTRAAGGSRRQAKFAPLETRSWRVPTPKRILNCRAAFPGHLGTRNAEHARGFLAAFLFSAGAFS